MSPAELQGAAHLKLAVCVRIEFWIPRDEVSIFSDAEEMFLINKVDLMTRTTFTEC